MMRCNFSRITADGAAKLRTAARLRPLLLTRMKTWRLPPRLASRASKKAFFLDDKQTTPSNNCISMATVIGNTYGLDIHTNNIPEPHVKLDCQDEDDDQGRRIDAAPASPSFRIYIADHHHPNGRNQAVKQTDSPRDVDLSETISVEKKVKRERKMRRHIKTVVSGKRREAGNAVKNLINVKGCYHPSQRSTTSIAVAENTTFRT